MVGTKAYASNYSTNVPRANAVGSSFMHAKIVVTTSCSASEAYYFFKLPPNCMVVGGVLTGSAPSGESGNACIIQVGSNEIAQKTLIGTFTISGSAALQQKLNIYQPVTVSDAGSLHAIPISAIVTTAASTATTSLSLYLRLEYVMFGQLD